MSALFDGSGGIHNLPASTSPAMTAALRAIAATGLSAAAQAALQAAGMGAVSFDLVHGAKILKIGSAEEIAFLREGENKDPTSTYNLGNRYAIHSGVERDLVASFASFLKAVRAGFPSAEFAVACLLSNGVAVTPDASVSKE